MKKVKQFFKDFSLLGILMLCVCVVIGVGDVSGAVMCADGTATALANGTQISTSERGALETSDYRQWSPNLIKDPIDQKIVQIRPYATLFDTILRYVGTQNTKNLEFKYYQISSREQKDKVVKFTPTINSAKQKCVGDLEISNMGNVDVTDNILVHGVSGADGEDLVLYVYGKENSKLKVIASEDQVIASGSDWTIPAIAKDTEIYLMGRSAAETDVTSPAIEYLPEEQKGYCQIFKCEITMSNYAKMADKEVKWDLSEIEEEALFDFRRAMEKSYLFGHKSKVYDPNKKQFIYRTGGIFNTVLKANKFTLNSAATDPNAELVDMMKHIFVGNSGAKERFALAGSEAVAKISKMQKVHKNQDAIKTEVIMGVTWSKIITNFGTLNIASHPVFDETPYGNYMLVIDPQFVKKWQCTPFERQAINGKETAIVNGEIVVFTETAGVAVYNTKAHCVVEVV